MRFLNSNKAKRTIFIVIFAILSGSGVGIVMLLKQNRATTQKEIALPAVDPDADVTIGKVHQVSSKNGKKEWVLDAVSAKMVEANNRLWLEKPTAVFFLKDGSEVHLEGIEGRCQRHLPGRTFRCVSIQHAVRRHDQRFRCL